MYLQRFSITELLILLTFLFISLIPFRLINFNNKLTFVNPLIIHNIFFIYYCFFSPIFRIIQGSINLRGFAIVDSLINAWIGALITVTFILVGYFLPQRIIFSSKKKSNLNYTQIWRYGFLLSITSFLLYFIGSGFDFSIFFLFSSEKMSIDFLSYNGSLKAYFTYSINFLITGTLLTTIASYKLKKKVFLSIFLYILTSLIFLKFGFRYRLLLLNMPLFLFYFLNSKLKPSTFFIAIPIGVFFANLLGIVRTYNRGLQLDNLTNYNLDTLLGKGFAGAESDIFISTAGIMSLIPEQINFINFTPIIQTLIYPIPNVLLNKNSGDYIRYAFEILFSSPEIGSGATFLNFGEYYYMFGWAGIMIFSAMIGFILKYLWIWINIHKEEKLALPLYLLNICYIFMIISRGYMPQQVLLYFFCIMPINLFYYFNTRKVSV